MVGTLSGARAALCDNLTSIDEGSCRVVYRQGDIVYKVEHSDGELYNANDYEWNAIHSGKYDDLPDYIRIPEFSRYDVDGIVVLAAPYIEGTKMGDCYGNWHSYGDEADHSFCLPPNVEEALDGADLAYGNVIFDGTTYWLVDVD